MSVYDEIKLVGPRNIGASDVSKLMENYEKLLQENTILKRANIEAFNTCYSLRENMEKLIRANKLLEQDLTKLNRGIGEGE